MDDEYREKIRHLKVLKAIQEYLKNEGDSATTLYPIKVPSELLYQAIRAHGAEQADQLIHHIFKLGLTHWSEKVFQEIFGSVENLEKFIELVKRHR